MFLIALANLISTVAPTTSFWDCGEYIAASKTVGVPHPPGAPLYLLIGRLFSMLPLAEDSGLRVNLVSTILSAFTILFLYLCIVRMARSWRGMEKTVTDKISVYGSAAVGALAFAFSHSFWFNAVEAEVYAVSMFFTALVFYLAMLWLDYTDVPMGNRILLFIFYIIGLSCGIHLLNILALISVTYIVAFQKREANFGNIVITGLIGSAIIFAIYPIIIQGIPFLISIEKLKIWSVVIILIGLIIATILFIKHDKRLAAFGTFAVLLVIIGYSTFLLIKIRSGLNPFLDENNPETWHKLLAYLNREQYGTESLFLTMFERKAPFWTYQIKKMYLRYLGWQYLEPSRFLALPFLLGMIGVVHHFYRDSKGAFTVLALFFMTGLAIVFYLNQDDPQPRERDYAYVGSYFAFAIWIGLGALALIELIGNGLKKPKLPFVAGSISAICIAAVPLNMWIQNYHSHDRSGNYVAWDYSYNLLNTCEPDAILFTNGDNDTFPLWYLQAVDSIRTDVRVVNLSLLNTGWFIKQIRDKEPKVPLPKKILAGIPPVTRVFNDHYIDNFIEARDQSAFLDRRWKQPRKVLIDGPTAEDPKMIWDVPATYSFPIDLGGNRVEDFHSLRVQDIMILNILAANRWKRPVYFAVTVSEGALIGLLHIGSSILESGDIIDLAGFINQLKNDDDQLSRYIYGQISYTTRQLIDSFVDNVQQTDHIQKALIDDINQLIQRVSLYDVDRFVDITLSTTIGRMMDDELFGEQLVLFNRMILEEVYPNQIKRGPKNYLTMEGLAFKVMPEPSPTISTDLMAENLLHKYSYRNLNDPKVYYDDNIIKLFGNYRQGMIRLAYSYINEANHKGDNDVSGSELPLAERIEKFDELPLRVKALTALDFMSEQIPDTLIPIKHEFLNLQIGQLYSQVGKPVEMRRQLDLLVEKGELNSQNAYRYGAYYLSEAKADDKAREMFDLSLKTDNSFENFQRIVYTWIQYFDDSTYAEELLYRYIDIDKSLTAKLQVASIAFMFNMNEVAYSIYEPMLRANPKDQYAMAGMIEYYRRIGKIDEAIKLVENWLADYPNDSTMAKKLSELRGIAGVNPSGKSRAQ